MSILSIIDVTYLTLVKQLTLRRTVVTTLRLTIIPLVIFTLILTYVTFSLIRYVLDRGKEGESDT